MTDLAIPSDHDVAATDTAARIAALDATANAWLEEHQPPNTVLAYQQDWAMWREYCAQAEIPETTNTSGALIGFVLWVGHRPDFAETRPDRKPAAPSTVDRRLTGAVVGLRARGYEPTKENRQRATEALKAYRRELAEAAITTGRGQSAPLTVKHLRTICAALPAGTIAGKRDQALILLAFSIAGRRSEVANLRVADVVPHDQGLRVTVRFGKTGARTVPVPRGSNLRTCPVLAWEAWLAASSITEGPAFRRVTKDDTLLAAGLSGAAAGAVLARAARLAGLSGWFTGHSARSGLATESRRAGHDPKTISATTGHSPNSRVLYDYMRVVDEWSDNALNGIGL